MSEHLFIPASLCLMRSAAWPQEKIDELLRQPEWIEAIFRLYQSEPHLQEALAIASPTLYQALQEGKGESLAASLFKYVIRMAKRATPFGLFSFIAPVQWGEKADVKLDLEKIQKKVRPDMGWALALLQEGYKDVSPELTVQMNQLVEKRGSRYAISYLRYPEVEENRPSETFFIRASPLVTAIFELVQKPKTVSALCKELLGQMPDLDGEKTKNVIGQLVKQQFLLPGILPSLLNESVFAHFLPYFSQKNLVEQILKEMQAYEEMPIGKGVASFAGLRKKMQALMPTKGVVQVDSLYGDTLALPSSVGVEICEAAEIIWRLSPRRLMNSPIQAYHGRFVEKYGTHRTVPLKELLSEDRGLGSFQKEEAAPPIFLDPFKVQWEKWLRREWEESMRCGKKEIVITKDLPERLYAEVKQKPTDPKDALVSMDLFFKVAAQTLEEVNEGHYLLELVQPSWHGGSALGRFSYLLGEEHQDRLRTYFEAEELLEKNSLFVEVSCWPQSGRNANVSNHPCLRKHRLDLHDHSGESFSLDDIYVGATGDRLYLTLKEGGKEIVYRTSNFLNSLLTPASFQLIREISLTRFQLFHPLSWGFLENRASFLPRIRFQKTILSPASWNLDSSSLSGNDIEKEFSYWADRWGLPDRSFLIYQDQHLLVDRRHPASIKEIVLRIKKGEPLRFVEEISQNWIKSPDGSHMAEFTLPIVKNPLYTKERSITPLSHVPISAEQRVKMPGDEWLYIKIYLEGDSLSLFLKERIVALAQEGYEFFFVRYADPKPHLRLRIKVSHEKQVFEQINSKAADWMKHGIVQHIAWVPYEREVERYGGMDLMDAAETLFCEDSLNILEELLMNAKATPLSHTLSGLRFLRGFGLSALEMRLLLEKRAGKTEALKGFREHRKDLVACSKEIVEQEILDFSKRDYSAAAEALPQESLYDIYSSMLHMHFNRLGCSRFEEERARIYALQTLLQLERVKIGASN